MSSDPIILSETTEHQQGSGTVTLWHAFFAAEIPYLTHFLSTYDDTRGPELRDRLVLDALGQQTAFLRGLHQTSDDRCSLELRMVFQPERHRVEIYFFGKASSESQARAEDGARRFWRHIDAAFPHQLYPLRPLGATEDAETAPVRLRALLELPSRAQDIVELRRHERQEHLELGQTGYVVYPLQGAPDSLCRLFSFLVGQSVTHIVSICIQPTELEPAERDLLGVIASACREQARRTEKAVTTSVEMVSIPAGDVADIYTRYLRQLQQPFLLRVSVAAEDTIEPGLLSALLADVAHPFQVDERLVPNRRGDFVRPRDRTQKQTALFNLRYLELYDWTPRQAEPKDAALSRLRRLVDAEEATSFFRLPVPPVGGLPGVDSRPPSLFEPLPEDMLHPPSASPSLRLGPVHLELRQLTQHALIAGTIGSGKTNTAVQILHELWAEHRIPFLVIEPVNAEHNDYRSLGRFFPIPRELRIFTLGDESTSPIRLNPFAVPPGVILNTHIAGLMACFLAALPLGDGPLPSLFREAIRNIYFARGWLDDERGGDDERETPSLDDLRDELEWLIKERYGSKSEVAQTLVGASVTRVNTLIHSSAGRILSAERSIAPGELFEKPTIFELRHLGSDEDKALLTAFLLLTLQEYCDRNRPVGGNRLHHVVLLEEAHNLMEKTRDGGAADAKAAAVRFFTNMLAENRKYGQGFLIVEQIPTLLAQGALKNTVIKVMHRLPGPDDIEAMGATMSFKERHKARAVALAPREGEAFFYADGLNEATLIHIPYFAKDQPLRDAEVREAMAGFRDDHAKVFADKLPFSGCRFCDAPCEYRSQVARLGYDRKLAERVRNAFRQADPKDRDHAVSTISAPIRKAVEVAERTDKASVGAIYCCFLHLRAQLDQLQLIADLRDFRQRLEAFIKS